MISLFFNLKEKTQILNIFLFSAFFQIFYLPTQEQLATYIIHLLLLLFILVAFLTFFLITKGVLYVVNDQK